MITNDEARIRVARGAAHLDMVEPGWYAHLDTGRLELACPDQCVLGQLHGCFFESVDARFPPLSEFTWLAGDLAVQYGFVPTDDEEADSEGLSYGRLQDAWIDAIADRRLRSQPSVEEPVSVAAVAKGHKVL